MGASIKYKKLFEVQILHDYYRDDGTTPFEDLTEEVRNKILREYDISQDLTIVPTRECQTELSKYNLIFKQTPTGFFVGVQVKRKDVAGDSTEDIKFQPFITFTNSFKLSFALDVSNPQFFNFTNQPITPGGKTFCYFSNLAGKAGSVFPSLSLPLATYKAGTTYDAGDLVLLGKHLYEALIETKDKPSGSATDWKQTPARAYAYSQNQVALQHEIYNYTFGAQNNTSTQILFTITNPTVEGDKKQEIYQESVTSKEPLGQYQLDLRGLTPGKYQLNVKGNDGYSDTKDFYLFQNTAGVNALSFGVIEIFYLPSKLLDGYALLDPTGSIVSPVYQIFFKNRSTRWRYIFSNDQDIADNQLGLLERDKNGNGKRRFTTKQPLPLTTGYEEVKKFDTDTPLPNPSPILIKPENKRLYSEIYINS